MAANWRAAIAADWPCGCIPTLYVLTSAAVLPIQLFVIMAAAAAAMRRPPAADLMLPCDAGLELPALLPLLPNDMMHAHFTRWQHVAIAAAHLAQSAALNLLRKPLVEERPTAHRNMRSALSRSRHDKHMTSWWRPEQAPHP